MPEPRLLLRWRYVLAIACMSCVLLAAAGCGSGDNLNRQVVEGTVTLDGKPLEKGTIRLSPASSQVGTDVSTEITNGNYYFSKSDGPVPGSYKVQINSIETPNFQPPAGKTPGEFVIPPAKQNIPEKYNVNTVLTATVKAGQSEPIDFPLSSKK